MIRKKDVLNTQKHTGTYFKDMHYIGKAQIQYHDVFFFK